MPIYIYRCKKCAHTTELIQSIKEAEEFLKSANYHCGNPDCESDEGERLIAKTNFKLQGGGWFKDGY